MQNIGRPEYRWVKAPANKGKITVTVVEVKIMRTQFKNSGIPITAIRADTVKMDEVSIRNLMAQKYAIDGHNMIAITDAAGLILYVNDLFCEVSEYDRSELIGKSMTILNSGYHPNSFWSGMWGVISGRVHLARRHPEPQ